MRFWGESKMDRRRVKNGHFSSIQNLDPPINLPATLQLDLFALNYLLP